MGTRKATLTMLLVLALVLVSFPKIKVEAQAKTINVPDDYTTIQDAIDNAVEGDTVFVKAGVYFENIEVDKSLSIVGEDKETTIIDGSKSGVVVKILRDGVNVTGFTIQNSNDDYTGGLAPWLPIEYSGIQLFEASYCNITGNKIIDNYYGIYLLSSSNYNSIAGNTITGNRFLGIALDSSSNSRFRNNNILDNRYYFRVTGDELSHYIHDIDISNLVNGKPIYYWTSRNDEIISMDAGYVALVNCVNITVQSLDLSDSNYDGIFLAYTINSTVRTNYLANNRNGIRLFNSEHNILLDNNFNNNENGISLSGSSNNKIFRNTITGNLIEDDRIQAGIIVSYSNENHISENQIAENSDYGIYFGGSCQYNEIIRNNITKNWDAGINFDAGGTVDDFHSSNYSSIIGNNIKENGNGILIRSSFGNKIFGNSIIDNTDRGIDLYGSRSQKSQIIGNNITNNYYGFDFSGDVKNNSVIGNNIQNNEVGIQIYKSNSNEFYHNNFIDNINQVFTGESTNIWDNGSEGNYWTNYTGIDNDNNRIGDTSHIIDANNLDRYPLFIPFMTHFFVLDAGIWEWTPFFVYVESNSTISEFSFDPEGTRLRFNVMGENETTGFCNVTIPNDLLNTEDSWSVMVDSVVVTPITVNEDEINIYIYFTYNQSNETVEIIGTDAIPEFPSWTLLSLFLVFALVGVLIKKRLSLKI